MGKKRIFARSWPPITSTPFVCASLSIRRPKKDTLPKKDIVILKHTLAMARRIKKAGMKFALDLHYSDTWADPDKQFKPSAWEGTTGAELEEKLYSYTKDVMIALKAGRGSSGDSADR